MPPPADAKIAPSGPSFDRAAADIVLVVDDQPDNLSLLHDALDDAGYTVLVATDGASALARAAMAQPDIVLLDALMPGLDGFEVARRLKASPATAAIPIVFMTGLVETEHVVAAFAAGGVDYVTKPLRPKEVLVRIAAHVSSARQARQARNALDAFGHATLVIRAGDGKLVWQTALARKLLADYFGNAGAGDPSAWLEKHAPPAVHAWLAAEAGKPAPAPLAIVQGASSLHFALHEPTGEDDGWLVVLREASDAALLQAMTLAFGLTAREAEVLYWVCKGKTNRDIGDILTLSPKTVTKHLEHVFDKLGVETRTAAANLAMGRVRGLGRG
jgi:CheY-like chemotaxis protein/DNA-binding CsgD family transcriptional regulator